MKILLKIYFFYINSLPYCPMPSIGKCPDIETIFAFPAGVDSCFLANIFQFAHTFQA